MSSEVQARFVDPRPAARALIAVFAAGVVLDVQRLVFAVAQQQTALTLRDLPHPTLHVVVRAATLLLFFIWFDRVWRNLAALARTPGQSRWATAAALFLPPLCFFRPVQICRDIWSGARRDGGSGDGALWFPRLVLVWWVALLAPPLLIVSGVGREGISPAERWLRLVSGESLNVIAGVLAIAVVYLMSERQSEVQLAWSALRRQSHGEAVGAAGDDSAIVADHPALDPLITIAPAQPVASSPRLRTRSVELLIREQTKRRPPLERAGEFVRGLVWPRQPRGR